MHSEQHEIEPFVNHIFMHWGQFLNHDITSLSVTRGIIKKIQFLIIVSVKNNKHKIDSGT